MKRVISALTLLAMACACAQPARAAVLQFGTDGFAADFLVAPGASVSVPVYLYETFTPGAETSLLDDEGGLLSTAIAIDRIGGGASDPAGILNAGDVAPNGNFNDTALLAVSLHRPGGVFERVTLREARDIFEALGVSAESPAGGVRRVLLGEFTFQAGALAGEVTAFRIQDMAASAQDDTVTWDLPGLALDGDIQTFEFTITTIPEPATITLMVILGCLTAARRHSPLTSGL